MNIPASIATAALLAVASHMAFAENAGAQPFADSTGGSSQIHGELAATAAGITPLTSSSEPADRDASVQAAPFYDDSTGGSSAARAEYLLDHARPIVLSAMQGTAGGRYQPYVDSTGGTSLASSERALEAESAAPGHRTAVAIAPTAHPSR